MKALVSVSLAELLVQLLAARRALRDRIPYDTPFMNGKPENVARDMWTVGSGLSAPWPVLAAHAAGTVLLMVRPRQGLKRAMGWLGSVYILGILWERASRESFQHPDKEDTPLIAGGLALSVAMAMLGLGGRRALTPRP
ncbi:hypothetical protein FHJ30_05975 [Arthrobacter sp. BB-1]|uniref:hypothetical protein n=1 Tax=unclassified Arthrobacter TaxID=235627 RepID=UPI00111226FA|nr:MULTISPECIES: hypothetical protein [unclassified Arthrobacter]TNB74237.1 hypothetical protein FHJ30_05975 [Arthrobacter sp. BB-1]